MSERYYLSHSEVSKLKKSLANINDVMKSCRQIDCLCLTDSYNLNEADTYIREFIRENTDRKPQDPLSD